MSDETGPSVEINNAPQPAAAAPAPIIMPSPPAAEPAPEVPGQWRSRHAMWLGTLVIVAHLALAIGDIGKAYLLWTDHWYATLTACAFIIGVKPGTDIFMAAVNRPKVVK